MIVETTIGAATTLSAIWETAAKKKTLIMIRTTKSKKSAKDSGINDHLNAQTIHSSSYPAV